MRSLSLLLVLTSVIILAAAASLSDTQSVSCPPDGELPCRCWRTSDELLHVDCNNITLTSVPHTFPNTTVVLALNGNHIERLSSGAFSHLHHLKTLYIEDNDLSVIEDNVFRNLHQLVKLMLRNNALTGIRARTFTSLLGLTKIDVRNNKIRHISRDAFKLLPQLREIDLTDNPLQCGCEMKRLRDWVRGLSPSLFLIGPNCENLSQRNIFRIGADEFGDCSEEEDRLQKCLECTGFTRQTECSRYGRTQTCSNVLDVCATTIQMSAGHQVITKQCQQSKKCIGKLMANPVKCSDESPSSLCQFCCTSATCNGNTEYPGYLYTVTLNVSLVLKRTYLTSYNDSTNLEFKDMQTSVNRSLTRMFTRLVSGNKHAVSNVRFSRDISQMVKFDCLLRTTSPLGQSAERLRDTLHEVWYSISTDGDLENWLDRYSFVISVFSDVVQCPRQVISDTSGVSVWPLTRAGVTAQIPCPSSNEDVAREEKNDANDEENVVVAFVTRKCYRSADGSAKWKEPNLSKCRAKQLRDLVSTDITEGNVDAILKSLATVTNASDELNDEAIGYSAQILHIVLNSDMKLKKDSATAVIHTFSNLLQVDIVTLAKSQRKSNATEKLLLSLEQMASKVVLPSNGQTTIVQRQIAVVILQTASVGFANGVRFMAPRGNLLQTGVELQINTTMTSSENAENAIYLPGYLLRNASSDVLQFTVFETDKFFKAIRLAASSEGSSFIGSSVPVVTTTYSRVIAASFAATTFTGLRQPVSITLPHVGQTQQQVNGQPLCVFWDFTAADNQGNWSTRGCMARRDTDNSTTCLCDHLTNFALLLDVYDQGSSISEKHQVALSIISYVGCGISLLAISLTLFTLLSVKKLYRTENPSKILTHLCCALIGLLVLFIVGTQPFVKNHTLTCKVFAGAMHYFVLATWLWMAVEAFYMYHALVKVFQTYYAHFLFKSMLIAWGVPLVAVAITAGIDTDNYQLQRNICWLSRDAFYGGLLAPVALIIITNCVVFALVMRQLHSAARKKLTQSQHTSTAVHLQRAASVMVLLGLTWAFAFFGIGGASIVFQYLFAVFNSLQGLFIFVFYCAMRKDVQQAWKDMFTCSSKPTTQTSSSSKGTSGQTTSSQLVTSRFRAVGHVILAASHMRGHTEQRYAVPEGRSGEQHCTGNHDNTQV